MLRQAQEGTPIAEVCQRRARHGCRYANQDRAARVESERLNCKYCCLHSRGRGLAIGRAARPVSSQAPVAVCSRFLSAALCQIASLAAPGLAMAMAMALVRDEITL